MNLAVVFVIVSTLVCVAVAIRALYNNEVDNLAILIICVAAAFLIAGAVVLHKEEKPEDYTQKEEIVKNDIINTEVKK